MFQDNNFYSFDQSYINGYEKGETCEYGADALAAKVPWTPEEDLILIQLIE